MDFQKRMEMTMKRYPYLVIEKDGAIQGYAYAGAFVGRAAYDWSCELTVYLDHTAQKCGLGRKIYEALENRLSEMGILNLYACIGYPRVEDEYLNSNSAEFHAHLGFSKVGEFYKCGYKTGRRGYIRSGRAGRTLRDPLPIWRRAKERQSEIAADNCGSRRLNCDSGSMRFKNIKNSDNRRN